MKKCQCYLIYDRANGNVARFEWDMRLFKMMMKT